MVHILTTGGPYSSSLFTVHTTEFRAIHGKWVEDEKQVSASIDYLSRHELEYFQENENQLKVIWNAST